MTTGPPSKDWTLEPRRPFINLEPPYEHHLAYQSRTPIAPETVRRAIYWSLLNAPTAGVSYGGHGVWGWDDGTKPPTDHAGTGTPLPWKQALVMPAAEQMAHVAEIFTSIDFWRLRPAPQVLAEQPGSRCAASLHLGVGIRNARPARRLHARKADDLDQCGVDAERSRYVDQSEHRRSHQCTRCAIGHHPAIRSTRRR
jgi:hypothetical protein